MRPAPSRLLPALSLALPLLLGGCLERAKPSVEQSVKPVQAVRVLAAKEAAPRHHAGLVKPRREADIGFRTGGRMIAREADIGSRVTAGQVLARLDEADLALGVRAAEADLASAEAQATMTAAEAVRSRTLAGQGWTATAIDEQKQAAARSAAQRMEAARASLALARNRLDHAVLRAPEDGVVTGVLADRGTVVAEGAPVFRLAEAGALEVEVQLPESALAEAAAAGATVALWARPEVSMPARLRELAAAATPGLRTYAARYTLEAPPDWMAIGMSATVALPRRVPQGMVDVPAAALADRGAGPILWVIDAAAGGVTARRVEIQSMRHDRALVTGVAPGELVVALGVHKLDPAARVRVAGLAGE